MLVASALRKNTYTWSLMPTTLPLALRPGSCTYQVPFFPPGKAVFASVGCSWPCDRTQVPQALLVRVMCRHWGPWSLEVAGLVCSSHCTSAAVRWLGTAEWLLRSQAGSLSASEASLNFCLSLLCFLKHIGKEDACCKTCSKRNKSSFWGLEW